MNNTCLIALCLLSVGQSNTQSTPHKPLHFDLSKIAFVLDGQQIFEDKGRLQDYPSKEMDRIVAAGTKSVPVLIGMIADTRMARTREPIVCYWPGMAVGDIAFCLLTDLFTDSSYTKTTMSGAGWNDILGPDDDNLSGWDQLHGFIKKHGRGALQAKWRKLLEKYKDQMFWDAKERCFRLKASH